MMLFSELKANWPDVEFKQYPEEIRNDTYTVCIRAYINPSMNLPVNEKIEYDVIRGNLESAIDAMHNFLSRRYGRKS